MINHRNADMLSISVGETWVEAANYLAELKQIRSSVHAVDFHSIQDSVDLVIAGVNATAEIDRESVIVFFSALVDGLWELCGAGAAKCIVPFECEPWELVLVADGENFRVTVLSVDWRARVVVHDVEINAMKFIRAVCDESEKILSTLLSIDSRFSSHPLVRDFSKALGKLHRVTEFASAPYISSPRDALCLGTTCANGFSFGVEMDLSYTGLAMYRGAHAFDCHSLLFPGRLEFEFGSQQIAVNGFPFNGLRGLVSRCRDLLNVMASSRSGYTCDSPISGLSCVVDSTPSGDLEIELGSLSDTASLSFKIGPTDFMEAVITIAELAVGALLDVSVHLQLNQRFVDFQAEVQELRLWLGDFSVNNSYLDNPEGFIREFGEFRASSIEPEPELTFDWPFADVRKVYPRHSWTTEINGINFDGISRCKETLIVPSSSSLVGIDENTGKRIWELEHPEARLSSYRSVGRGIIAVADEETSVFFMDAKTGERLSKPQKSVGALLVDAMSYDENDFFVTCDFDGRLRGFRYEDFSEMWRLDVTRGCFVGAAAHGPLVCSLTNSGYLRAINPTDGSTLWRIRLGGIAERRPTFHDGRIFTFSYDPITHYLTIHAVFPFTGRVSWQLRMNGRLAGDPVFHDGGIYVPIEKQGKVFWCAVPTENNSSAQVSWRLEVSSAGLDHPTLLPIDETTAITRTDRGDLMSIDLKTGEPHWTVERSPPELLYRNLSLYQVADAFVAAGAQIEIRSLEAGDLLHQFGEELVAPEYFHTSESLRIVYGEKGSDHADPDLLTSLTLGHFLAIVTD